MRKETLINTGQLQTDAESRPTKLTVSSSISLNSITNSTKAPAALPTASNSISQQRLDHRHSNAEAAN